MSILGNIRKIEASFWGTIINLMTNSSTFQSIIKKSFELVKDHEFLWLAGLILAWTAAGLTVGYFFGFDGLR